VGENDAGERQHLRGSEATSSAPLANRLRAGLGKLRSRADRGAGRVLEAARDLRRPVLQHAVAARERGNFEAAFWLLAEEHRNHPEDRDVAARFWETALALHRIDLATSAGAALVVGLAADGDVELATQYWVELVGAVPDALVPATSLALILPELRRRERIADDELRVDVHALLRRAVRHAVDPRNEGLGPGVALRVFEEGHEANPEAARRAAEVALASPNLHETKRERLRAWLDAGAPGAAAGAPEPEAAQREPEATGIAEPGAAAPEGAEDKESADGEDPRVVWAVPLELGEDAIRLRVEGGRLLRLAWEQIGAVAAFALRDPPRGPFVDLVCRWPREGDEPVLVLRLDAGRFDPVSLVPHRSVDGPPLSGLLGALLEHSRGVPLPDPESALGLRLAEFASFAEYESEVLAG